MGKTSLALYNPRWEELEGISGWVKVGFGLHSANRKRVDCVDIPNF